MDEAEVDHTILVSVTQQEATGKHFLVSHMTCTSLCQSTLFSSNNLHVDPSHTVYTYKCVWVHNTKMHVFVCMPGSPGRNLGYYSSVVNWHHKTPKATFKPIYEVGGFTIVDTSYRTGFLPIRFPLFVYMYMYTCVCLYALVCTEPGPSWSVHLALDRKSTNRVSNHT